MEHRDLDSLDGRAESGIAWLRLIRCSIERNEFYKRRGGSHLKERIAARLPKGWLADVLLAGLVCTAGTPIVVLLAGFPGNPERPGLSSGVLYEMMFSVPASAVFAAVMAMIIYGAAAPADKLTDAARARWAVRLSVATGLWLFLVGVIAILHSTYHPHGQSI